MLRWLFGKKKEPELVTEDRKVPRFICPYCDAPGHTEDCPAGKLEALELGYRVGCPFCKDDRSVADNRAGFYECRLCQTQFIACDQLRKVKLPTRYWSDEVLPWPSGKLPAYILPMKGDGQFPIDEEMAKLRQQMEEIKKKKSQPES